MSDGLDKKKTFNWTRDNTLIIIAAYWDYEAHFTNPNYKKKVIWEKISSAVQAKYSLGKREACENRWKVLMRNYRRVVDNNKETGKIRNL